MTRLVKLRWIEDGLVLRTAEVELPQQPAARQLLRRATEAIFSIPVASQRFSPLSALAEFDAGGRAALDVCESDEPIEDAHQAPVDAPPPVETPSVEALQAPPLNAPPSVEAPSVGAPPVDAPPPPALPPPPAVPPPPAPPPLVAAPPPAPQPPVAAPPPAVPKAAYVPPPGPPECYRAADRTAAAADDDDDEEEEGEEAPSKWASDAVLSEPDPPPTARRRNRRARRLDDRSLDDLPPLEAVARPPARAVVPPPSAEARPVRLDRDGYVIEDGASDAEDDAEDSEDGVLDAPIPGLDLEDDPEDPGVLGDDGGGEPRYSGFRIAFSGNVPVVVVDDIELEVDQAGVARELEVEHGFDVHRAREVAATAERMTALRRGPPPTEEGYIRWWARKYGDRERLRSRLQGGGPEPSFNVDPMARVARRMDESLAAAAASGGDVMGLRLLIDDSDAAVRRRGEEWDMARHDAPLVRAFLAADAARVYEAAAMAEEDGVAFSPEAHAAARRVVDDRTSMASEDVEGGVLRTAPRARRRQRPDADALGARLGFGTKRRVFAYLPARDMMRCFCASRQLAVDGFGGVLWRTTALRDFGVSPNDPSWFGGDLRLEEELRAQQRMRALPAPGLAPPPGDGAPMTPAAVGAGYRRELYRSLSSQRIWAWGRGAAGTLGFDDDATRTRPKELKSLRGVPVKQLVAGPHHSAVLDWSGGVYSWGFDACLNARQRVQCVVDPSTPDGDKTDTGTRAGEDTARRTPVKVGTGLGPRATDLDLLDDGDALRTPPPAVRQIASDSTSVVAVGENATATRLGGKRLDAQIGAMDKYDEARKRPPEPVASASIAAICCGLEHSVALERSGRIWSWRAARHPPRDVQPRSWAREIARLLNLRDESLDEVLLPVPLGHDGGAGPARVVLRCAAGDPIPDACKSPAVSVAIGAYHTAYLTAAGHVFTCGLGPAVGRGAPGAKARGDGPDDVAHRVGLENVVWLGSGHSHVCAIDLDGYLWLWGEGDVVGDAAPAWRPYRAPLSNDRRVLAAACGPYHALAMTCDRAADVPVACAHYLDRRVDASEWLLHARIRTNSAGRIAPLTHARRGVAVPEALRDLGAIENAG